MEIPKIKIPMDEIFKVFLLDNKSNIKKIIIFSGNDEPNIQNSDLFSDNELIDIHNDNPEIIYSKQMVHYDDSIINLKTKIIHELGIDAVSYFELYLFASIKEKINLLNFYNEITKNQQLPFTSDMLNQLIINLDMDTNIINEIPYKDYYDYDDLLKLYIEDREHTIKTTIGQRFIRSKNYLFSANPFDIISSSDYVFENNSENPLISFEYSLLFNYGDFINKTIYLCYANDIYDFAIDNSIKENYITKHYFPLLSNHFVSNKQQLIENKRDLLKENNDLHILQQLRKFETIDVFYKIFYSKTSELNYINKGIQSFHVVLHPETKTIFPLETIFKNIHVSSSMPYIKYNPGVRHENLYRLYSTKISKTGKKIPYLSKSTIMNLSKQTGKSKQISFYIKHDDSEEEFYIDFEHNGNIHIKSDMKNSVNPEQLNAIIKNIVNPIIDHLNDILEQNGYKIHKFIHLHNNNVEFVDMKLVYSIHIGDKKINLTDYKNCLTSIFTIPSFENISEGTQLTYKMVENYREMDEVSSMIRDIYEKTGNERAIVVNLMENFKITENEAFVKISQFLNDFTRIQGKFVNKENDIAETPGFQTMFQFKPFERKFIIEMDKISSIQYIPHIDVYLDSFLRLFLNPESMDVNLKYIKKVCSKTVQEVELKLNTVIAPKEIKMQPITFAKKAALPLLDMDDTIETELKEVELEQQTQRDLIDEDEMEEEGMIFDDDEEEPEPIANPQISETMLAEANKIQEEMEEEEEGMIFSDDEDEDSDSNKVSKGGAIEMLEDKDLDGKIFKKKEYFLKRMTDRDKNLFNIEEKDGFTSYSRICQTSTNLQPVILTQEEKDTIDKEFPGSYSKSIKYGSDPEKPFYYICPRYWCLKTNTSISEADVKAGKCGKVMEANSDNKPIKPGHYVYEFTDPKYHKDEKGNYVQHYPGFKPSGSHPKDFCLPCCYNNWDNPSRKKRREQCLNPSAEKDVGKEVELQSTNYIIGVERAIIPQQRFGFLPPSIEAFFNIDHNKLVTKNNAALIKDNTPILLRYGIEQNKYKSFIGCVADIYSEYVNINSSSKKINVPKIKEMMDIISKSINLDMFIKYHNGSLPSIFKSKKKIALDQVEMEIHNNTEFYKSIDFSNEHQIDFLEDTIMSFNNFIAWLNDENSVIDYTYLWDFITNNNSKLFDSGLNLVILNIVNNDITDNMEIICPTNPYSSKMYDPRKNTVFILKRNDVFEPIYLYEINNKNVSVTKLFHEARPSKNNIIKNIKKIFKIIQNTMTNTCYPKPSMPNVYKFKRNVLAFKLYSLLKNVHYNVVSQVMNYQGKIIGLLANRENSGGNSIFVPCFPSSKLEDIHVQFMDDNIWNDYRTTRDKLIKLSEVSENKIFSKPMMKIMEDNLIIGILTETNQFVKVEPPQENIEEDDLIVVNSTNYLIADNIITNVKEMDVERIDITKKIFLESQFYNAFRTNIRTLLNDPINKEIREKLLRIINNKNDYYLLRLDKIEYYLRKMAKGNIVFTDIEPDVLNMLDEVSTCTTNCKDKKYCLIEDETCKLILPKTHLLTNYDNKTVYFGRMADELLRYNRIKLFMFQPKTYLNLGNNEYKINKDEFIMLQSLLTNEYFEGLEPFQQSEYLNNITFELAKPSVSKRYDNVVLLEEQGVEREDIGIVDDLAIQCIIGTRDVIGRADGFWKNVFPKSCKEIMFQNSNRCSFYVLIYILQEKTKTLLSIEDLKRTLWSVYKKYIDKYRVKIEDILYKQGKRDIIKTIKSNAVNLETIIMSESYYLTDLDIWIFANEYKLPIILFSTNPFKVMVPGVNWLLLGGLENYTSNEFYFIRTPHDVDNNVPPKYNLIKPKMKLNELKGFDAMLENALKGIEYTDNITPFSTFIEGKI
jgi:hypothetical protein